MYNIMAIFGKSGAGKDTLLRQLSENKNFHAIVSYTTRPPRDYEKNNTDYHFVSKLDFAEMINKGEMLEYTNFNNWYYGTGKNDLMTSKINVGVFNPDGIISLIRKQKEQPKEYNIFYCMLAASDKNLLLRCLNREERPDCYEICRRFITDKEDFEKLLNTDAFNEATHNHNFAICISGNDENKFSDKIIEDLLVGIGEYFQWDFHI